MSAPERQAKAAGKGGKAKFAWDDPLPFLVRFGNWLERHLRGQFRRQPGPNL